MQCCKGGATPPHPQKPQGGENRENNKKQKKMKFKITAWNGGTDVTPNAISDAKSLARELDAYLSTVSGVFGWFIGGKGFLFVGENKNTFGLFVDGCDAKTPVAVFDANNYTDAVTLAVDIIRAYNRSF